MAVVRFFLAGCICAGALTGCAEQPLVVRTDEPMLLVVLTPDTLSEADTLVAALLGTTGTPLSFEYRVAEHFSMRRASDDAPFVWREIDIRGGDGPSYFPRGPNYGLAPAASAAGLGRADLVPGETYALEVATSGRVITGSTTIPARPRLVVRQRTDGRRVVEWQRDPGVGLYVVNADTDRVPNQETADTFFVLRDDMPDDLLPAQPRFRITASDTSRARYLVKPEVTSAGLVGAYGLFGAMIGASIDLPPRHATTPAR
jgi:hypothetical protein